MVRRSRCEHFVVVPCFRTAPQKQENIFAEKTGLNPFTGVSMAHRTKIASMAHLWIYENNQWNPRAATGATLPIPGADGQIVIRRAEGGAPQDNWHLLAPPSRAPRVNGQAVALGIRALRDRDEICLPGRPPLFFSTEQLVAVEPFTGLPDGRCPRCTKIIPGESPAVRCSGCNTWYHAAADRNCYTYGENPICVVCGADAVVSGEFGWSPEEL
jgi:hypothetical protein